MKKYSRTYWTIWAALLSISVTLTVTVRLGHNKVRIHGAQINLAPYSNYQLYKINDTFAFEINGERIAVVSYKKTSGLYAMAGDYVHAPVDRPPGVYMQSEVYQKGDYLYSSFHEGRTTILNWKTGETIGPLVQPAEDHRTRYITDQLSAEDAEFYRQYGYRVIELSQLPEYRQRGLVFDEQYRMTLAKIVAGYKPLNTFSENLFCIQLALLAFYIIMALAGLPILFARIKSGFHN